MSKRNLWLGAGLLVLAACSSSAQTNAKAADVAFAADLGTVDAAADESSDLFADATPIDVLVDDTVSDVNLADMGADVDAAAPDVIDVSAPDTSDVQAPICTPGQQSCQGIKLATCGTKGDGYIVTNCFPGTACSGGACKPVTNNLVIIFDSSGSMDTVVKKKDGTKMCATSSFSWPTCEYGPANFPPGCTSMGVSKSVFTQALAKLDDATTKMLMFRFPQKASSTGSPSCSSGYYSGQATVTGDTGVETVSSTTTWYWNNLSETLCEPFPADNTAKTKDGILKWMDGVESKAPVNPELRPTGTTPIGKTLFYVGEYLRSRVIIDGQPCTTDASCKNVNYVCQDSKCVDPVRSCRETDVVLFTDGGETNSNTFFAPWVQAKRLSYGLACTSDADCVGGSICKTFKQCLSSGKPNGKLCTQDVDCLSGTCAKTAQQQCMPAMDITGYFCTIGGTACLPDIKDPTSPTFCDTAKGGQCVQDPRPMLTVAAKVADNNVLRSPDGKPFGVRVHVVDISGDSSSLDSMSLALSGNGKLLGADASDPEQFLGVLDAAFDIKTMKVCGAQ